MRLGATSSRLNALQKSVRSLVKFVIRLFGNFVLFLFKNNVLTFKVPATLYPELQPDSQKIGRDFFYETSDLIGKILCKRPVSLKSVSPGKKSD